MANTVMIEHYHADFPTTNTEAPWDLIKVGRKWEVHEIFFFQDEVPELTRISFGYGPYKTKTEARSVSLSRRKRVKRYWTKARSLYSLCPGRRLP
jgi:hypothetical protein